MKTKIISKLKKEVLVIEFPEGYELAGVTNGAIYYYDNQMNYEDYPLSILVEGSFTLLGKPDEIKEDDAKKLVHLHENGYYKDYINGNNFFTLPSKSLLSSIESKIFWENPHGKEEPTKSYFLDENGSFLHESKQWKEAQEKTFDKSRTLIFVKN